MTAAFLLNALLVLAAVVFLANAGAWLGPKRSLEGEKGLPYETGMPPQRVEGAAGVSYYRFAVLFVIFDVDLAFLVPWVLVRRDLDLGAMLALSGFVLLVGFTLAYVWRKGILRCE